MVSGVLPRYTSTPWDPPKKPRSENFAALWCISIWVLLSCIIILSNKWILERFPFSMALTTWHMFFATICTQILSRTTTLISKPTDMTPRYYFRAVVPIAACFSVSLICSNMVYLYLSMSFIQVLKASGPVATVLACWSIGLRNPEPSLRIFMIICMIVFGVMLSSLGELKFVWLGFLLQCAGVVSEAYKNALQQFLLGGTRKMNSITLLYYFAPACTILNLACVIIFEIPKMQTVGFEGVSPWVFLVNGVLCFGLNLASIAVIKRTSSTVLTICGIPKSMLLVGLDMVLYLTPMTLLQAIGFSIASYGTYQYSQISQKPAVTEIGTDEEKEALTRGV